MSKFVDEPGITLSSDSSESEEHLISEDEVINAARSLLSLSVDDFEPFRDDFTLYAAIAISEMIQSRGLTRRETRWILKKSATTTYRRLHNGRLSAFFHREKVRRRSRAMDRRTRVFTIRRPSENPHLTKEQIEEVRHLEMSIVSILGSRRLFLRFLREISRGLMDPATMDRVLDNLMWLNSVLHDAYLAVIALRYFEVSSREDLYRIQQVLNSMNRFFGKGKASLWGRALLIANVAFWQGLIDIQPELEGIEDFRYLYNGFSRPFLSRSKE